jgi:hypothetical protein
MASKFPYMAVDTESDFNFVPPLFLGMSIAIPGSLGTYLPRNLVDGGNVDDEVFELGLEVIRNAPRRVFQHAGHDLVIFEKIGVPLLGKFACTMIMAHMINENLLSKSLDHLHKHYCGGEGKKRHPFMQTMIDTLGWSYVPTQLMYVYGKQDAVATLEVFEAIYPLYKKQFGELYATSTV